MARQRLALAEPQALSLNKGAVWQPERQALAVPSLGDTYLVSWPGGAIALEGAGEADPRWQVLLLHYLTGGAMPLQASWISFKELPGGALYQQPFHNRAVLPLVRAFGAAPTRLIEAGLRLAGQSLKLGSAAVELRPFPQLPLACVVWAGDEELPASGTILFDAAAPHLLPTEDFAVLAELTIKRLRQAAPA